MRRRSNSNAGMGSLWLVASWKKKVGDTVVVFAGAPGIGRIVYRVTRIDADGVFGFVVENSIEVLDPSDCV
jgi:NADPH-dependent curcumin reductase CurA